MKKNFHNNFFIVLLILSLFSFVILISPFLLSMYIGAILSMIVHPTFLKLRALKVPKSVAASLLAIAITLSVIGPLVGFTILLAKDMRSVAQKFQEGSHDVTIDQFYDRVEKTSFVQNYFSSHEDFRETLKTQSKDFAKTVGTGVVNVLSSIPDVILHTVLVMITCFFALTDGPKAIGWTSKRVPLSPVVKTRLSKAFRNVSVGCMTATLACAAAQSFVISMGFIFTKTPFLLLAAGASFILAWLPIVGVVPVWVLACAYHFLGGSVGKGIIMLIFGLVSGIVDNIIRPWFLKGSAELNPLLSLVATFGGVAFFGIFGVFVGPTLAGIVVELLDMWPSVEKQKLEME